jgi:CRP/FNR family cyclic AMP-dependent transcriptional regulator
MSGEFFLVMLNSDIILAAEETSHASDLFMLEALMEMIDRFRGEDGKRHLNETLTLQTIVRGDKKAAARLAEVSQLRQLTKGETLIEQGAADNDIYFILSGKFLILVNDREVARRTEGLHIGEMAMIDHSAPRSATVIAQTDSVVAKVSEPDFARIANDYPRLWRELALEVCRRLRQRNELVPPRNPRPIAFVGSSKESLPIAGQIAVSLTSDDIVVRLWTDNVFNASSFPIEDLEVQIASSDFAILVLGPDDLVASRGSLFEAPRDNTVFELGLFMGASSHSRVFLVVPEGVDIKIPSDLLGLTPIKYKPASIADLPDALESVCKELERLIMERGPK